MIRFTIMIEFMLDLKWGSLQRWVFKFAKLSLQNESDLNTALHRLLNRIESAFEHMEVALGTFLNMERSIHTTTHHQSLELRNVVDQSHVAGQECEVITA